MFFLNDTFKTSVRAWRQEGSRMFLEPDKNITVEFLPELIEKYQAEGYEFCTY